MQPAVAGEKARPRRRNVRVMHRGGFPARLVVAGTGPLAASLRLRARGLPVELVGHVAASTSAVVELVGDGAGRSARPQPPALAAAVAAVLAVPGGQRRVAARARAESFPWSRTADAMLALHGFTLLDSAGVGSRQSARSGRSKEGGQTANDNEVSSDLSQANLVAPRGRIARRARG